MREIGTGAYGKVYEIRRSAFGIEERCAMKVLHVPSREGDLDVLRCEGMDDETIAQTYQGYIKDMVREYRIMAGFKNAPNIVHVDDFIVQKEDGGLSWTLYIKMELLTPIMKDIGCITTESQVLKMAKDMARALVVCHSRNVLHRDVKPQNIFIDNEENFKLGDFGVSRVVDQTTHATVAVGTYNYMSPETLSGNAYGAQADIYSLGMVLYWALNKKRLPFLPLPPEGYTASMAEEARRRRHRGEPVPPPADGNPEFKKVVMKACEFDVNDRFLTAQNLLDALNSIPDPGDDVVPPPPSSPTPPPKPPRKMPWKKIIKSSIIVLVSIAVIALVLQIGSALFYGFKFKEITNDIENETESSAQETETNSATETTTAVETQSVTTEPIVPSDTIISVDGSPNHGVALYSNGTVDFVTEDTTIVGAHQTVPNWTNVVKVCAGSQHTVALKEDGTVVAAGFSVQEECNVSSWEDIVDIAAGTYFTAGLKSDGTVVYAGHTIDQNEILNLRNVIKIDATAMALDCLLADGTWIRLGKLYFSDSYSPNGEEYYSFTDIGADANGVIKYESNYIDISTGEAYSVGLKPDGTVDLIKNISLPDFTGYPQPEVLQSWKFDTSDWKDITDVSVGYEHIVGLRENGTVVATGFNGFGQCDVEDWTEIVEVVADHTYTIGLRADGTIVTAGQLHFPVEELNRKEPVYSLYPTLDTDEDGFVILDNSDAAPGEIRILGYRNSLGLEITNPYVFTDDGVMEIGFSWVDNETITKTLIGGGGSTDFSAEKAQVMVNRVLPEWKQYDWFVSSKSLEKHFTSNFQFVPSETYYALLVSFDKDLNYISYTVLKIGCP